jgi:hypothetical protein
MMIPKVIIIFPFALANQLCLWWWNPTAQNIADVKACHEYGSEPVQSFTVSTYKTAWCHLLQDYSLDTHHLGNLKKYYLYLLNPFSQDSF